MGETGSKDTHTFSRDFAYDESLQSALRLLRSRSSRYAWVGTLIAVAAVVLACLMVAQHFYGHITYENVLRAQRENVAIWVLDTLPFLYAIWGQIASMRVTKDAGSAIKIRTKSLRHQLRRARYDARARTEYFARLSHEFRMPLNSILGVSENLLETSAGGRGNLDKQVRIIQGAAENLLTLVNDVLDFSAIETGNVDLDRVEFDLHECITNACEMLRSQAERKGLVLQVSIRPDVPRQVIGDPGRLRQVLVNIVGNAIKYTQRGTVDVVLRHRGDTVDRMHEIVLEVRDTGIGMDEKQLRRLFEPYQRGGGPHIPNTGPDSTGLGMAITQELVDAMHGAIDVETAPGQGSIFEISLKLDRSRGVSIDTVARHIELRGTRVLVVDEPGSECDALLAQLKALEIDVETADDGIEGLKAALKAVATGRPFDIMLTEMHLDYLSGEDLGRALRERRETSDICSVMMTQVGTRGDAKRLKQIGFSGYFLKPIPPEHLGELLRATLATMTLSDEQRATQGLVTRYYIRDQRSERMRVLAVEDDPIGLEVIMNQLERLGCEVSSAATGADCLEVVSRSDIDLVLLDQNLPDMRGDEVVERMPRIALTGSPPPIVMFSAGLTQAEKQRCRTAGVAGFLTKPATIDGLRDTLKRFGWRGTEESTGKEKPLPGLKSAFARESRQRIEDLQQSLGDSLDRQAIYRIAHTMRSATRHVGADELSGEFDRLESRLANGSDDEIREIGETVMAAWREVVADIEMPADQTVRLGVRRGA